MGDLIANGLWFAVAWYAARDVLLIGERLADRWEQHRDECEHCYERAMRRAQKRRHGRRALEATPPTGRGLPMPRAWLKAPTGAAGKPSPVGAPKSPVAAERRDESSRAGEVSACRGDTTWTRSGPAPTPVDAVNPRLAASAGLPGHRHG